MSAVEVKVPDIGDLGHPSSRSSKAGDAVKVEDSLVTRIGQGDDGRAFAIAGTVKKLKVVRDKVSEGR
jgi:hypothetical protein